MTSSSLKAYFSFFLPKAPVYLVYMLQQVEYHSGPYGKWVERLMGLDQSLSSVMYRKHLDYTRKAKLLVGLGYVAAATWAIVVVLVILSRKTLEAKLIWLALGLLPWPFVLHVMYMLISAVADLVYRGPTERARLEYCRSYLDGFRGKVVVVAGSYGKTTMKELLAMTLGASFKVAATTGNGNTPSAHAAFLRTLDGDEDYLIFELGEGKPGDVEQFASALRPDYAVVTGLAPNHLDQYKTLDALAADILTLKQSVSPENIYFAGDSELLTQYLTESDQRYSKNGGPQWKNTHISAEPSSTTFELEYDGEKVVITSRFLGRHQVAALAFGSAFAATQGVALKRAAEVVGQVLPYQHRMQPYGLGGAVIIDDTYNGNLEGMLAGLALLDELPSSRKIYVTPGLVDQGDETETVHKQIAGKIATVKPDLLVLMQNSATDIIREELATLKYDGEIRIEPEPLLFYENLDQFVRAGDVVLMQNDWTDNYA